MRKIDTNGDLVTSGEMFAYESEEVALNIQTRLKLFLGENPRNTGDGTPWFQDVLLKNPDIKIISEMLKKRIDETEGVQEILSLNATQDLKTRKLSITGQVLTTFGATVQLGGMDVTV